MSLIYNTPFAAAKRNGKPNLHIKVPDTFHSEGIKEIGSYVIVVYMLFTKVSFNPKLISTVLYHSRLHSKCVESLCKNCFSLKTTVQPLESILRGHEMQIHRLRMELKSRVIAIFSIHFCSKISGNSFFSRDVHHYFVVIEVCQQIISAFENLRLDRLHDDVLDKGDNSHTIPFWALDKTPRIGV